MKTHSTGNKCNFQYKLLQYIEIAMTLDAGFLHGKKIILERQSSMKST